MKTSKWLRRMVLLSVVLCLVAAQVPAQDAARPKLVVVLVIDQFRADYLERFRSGFGPGGFRRLMHEGAYFTECFYPYAHTETAPGHATLATGTTPDRHGIIGNTWYDAKRKRVIQAIEDDQYPAVGASSTLPGISPRNLMADTWADELRLATENKARVFGVALKDRAAILSTGFNASGAYWYDSDTGAFMTSAYYTERLPGWVNAFNGRRPSDAYYGKDWKIGSRVALVLTTPEGKPGVAFNRAMREAPYANDLTLEFARALMENEKLGTGPATDFLFVGFSANDYVGHRWGPYSEEVRDITLRTDRLLAEFLQYLDQRFGKENYWFALAADHGVAPTLVQARAHKLAAKNLDTKGVQAAVEKALTERWGAGAWLVPRAGLTFNRETLANRKVTLDDAARVAGDTAMTMEGIEGYVNSSHSVAAESVAAAFRKSTFAGRSADVQIVQEPFSLWDGERGGTSHGTPYSYDTHVPLILVGRAFRSGRYTQRVSPADLATTISAALGINPPALATGRVLSEALASSATPATRPAAAAPPGR